MKVKIYEGESLGLLKELLHLYAVDYFCDNYEFGGLMWDDWEGGFMLPYQSKEVISTSFFGMFKKYKYNVDTWNIVAGYLNGRNTDVSGYRLLETTRGIIRAITVAENLGGSIELNLNEISIVEDIIRYKG